MLKVYLKDIMYVFATILIGTFLFTLLNYFNIAAKFEPTLQTVNKKSNKNSDPRL